MISSPKLQRTIRFCRQRPLGAIGGLIFLVMVFTAVFADWIAPYDPLINDYGAMLSPPSMKHPMGTDAHGRDVLSRIIYGSRTALLVGFCSSFFGTSLGAIIGVLCAYFAGKTDVIIQRFMEILLSFPLIVMDLAMMASSCVIAELRTTNVPPHGRPAGAGSTSRQDAGGGRRSARRLSGRQSPSVFSLG